MWVKSWLKRQCGCYANAHNYATSIYVSSIPTLNCTVKIELLIVKICDQGGSDSIWSSKILTATPHTKVVFGQITVCHQAVDQAGPPQIVARGQMWPGIVLKIVYWVPAFVSSKSLDCL